MVHVVLSRLGLLKLLVVILKKLVLKMVMNSGLRRPLRVLADMLICPSSFTEDIALLSSNNREF